MPNETRLLSVPEVADYLGIAVQTLYDWRQRNIGPPTLKIGGRVRYDPDDLARWVRENRSAVS